MATMICDQWQQQERCDEEHCSSGKMPVCFYWVVVPGARGERGLPAAMAAVVVSPWSWSRRSRVTVVERVDE